MSFFILKLSVTVGLIWLVLSKVDLAPLEMRFTSLQTGPVAAALVILLGQLVLTGIRWYLVAHILGINIKLGLATQLSLVGQFFNQVLPSSVGGDGVRAWLLSREGIPVRRALISVVCDRVTALVLLVVMVAVILPVFILCYGWEIFPSAQVLAIGIGAASLSGLLCLFFGGGALAAKLMHFPAGRPLAVLFRDLRLVLFSSKKSLWVVLLSIVVQILVIASVFFLAMAMQVKLGTVQLLMLPLILLLSSIPISFAGWGLRESTMVIGLGFVGVSASDALAISVSFGLGQLVIGLPGLILSALLVYGRKKNLVQSPIVPVK
jgi:hypothetical protein